jgi:hypothetical protein
MRNPGLALAIGLCLLMVPGFAEVSKKTVAYRKTVRRGYHRQVVYRKKQEQQKVFSFLDAPEPAQQGAKPVELTKPLTGIVVKHQVAPELPVTPLQNIPIEPASRTPVVTVPVSDQKIEQATQKGRLNGNLAAWIKPRSKSKKPIVSAVQSWVMPIKEAPANELAKSIAAFIAYQKQPTVTTLYLAPPANSPDDNPLTQALSLELRKAGFALASHSNQVPGVQTLQYVVSPLEIGSAEGILIRIRINGLEASRWFQQEKPGSSVLAASPFTVKEVRP